MKISDDLGRTVSYLRLSVTDRCNLRCIYCFTDDFKFIPHPNILRYEEMLRLINIASSLDINKLRLTGGEPFARKGFMSFIAEILKQQPEIDLRITTNGTLIADQVKELKNIGVSTLNISLDTLNEDNFEKITGRRQLHDVLNTIDQCLSHSIRIKINVVAMKGINDHELPEFINFIKQKPIDLRFIEFMPMGEETHWSKNSFWSAKEIVDSVKAITKITSVSRKDANNGPARMFRLNEGVGRLGVISPVSSHFCGTCNRLRITSEGDLRTCLFSDKTYNLRNIMRNEKLSDADVKKIIIQATKDKPLGHDILKNKTHTNVCKTQMSSIGG